MLFNSLEFIFVFLPIVVVGFFLLARFSFRAAASWLAIVSVFFYGWWNMEFVLLLVSSVIFNYILGIVIAHQVGERSRKFWLWFALFINLILLAYYKYADFFIGNSISLIGQEWAGLNIILPLGISFFTFTQIAFLVDVYRRIATEYRFIHYLLFVTYFPHLIAGPLLHHAQMIPQFAASEPYRFSTDKFSLGATIFSIGLAKKVLIADNISEYSSLMFDSVASGADINFFFAWAGAIAYTLQLYFDFSGYSDMAIGLSALFGIVLPINFNSPYKALNIIEFWRRWHMTLSQFLRDYLYIPLGGNRNGCLARYRNILVTMLLGGMWHGASWNFIIWGGIHGVYLIVNYSWIEYRARSSMNLNLPRSVKVLLARTLTFLAVVVAWVFFRAENLDAALAILNVMSEPSWELPYFFRKKALLLFTLGLVIIFFCPNTQEICKRLGDGGGRDGLLRLNQYWGAIFGFLFVTSIICIQQDSEFLYFQF